MKSFEQVYKNILKKDLESLLGRKVLITNDINYRPLEKDKSNIVVVITTGQGTKSSVPSYDLTTLPLNINFIVDANYAQELIGLLNKYIKDGNGKTKTIKIDKNEIVQELNYYRVVYNNPTPYGGMFDLQTPDETFKAIMVLLTGTVVYSSNVLLDQFIPVLKISGSEYPMNYLIRCEFTTQPVTDPSPITGQIYSKKTISNIESVYHFTLLGVDNDSICSKLYRQFVDEMIDYDSLYLKIDNDNYLKMQSMQITYSWEDGVSIYNLTLIR